VYNAVRKLVIISGTTRTLCGDYSPLYSFCSFLPWQRGLRTTSTLSAGRFGHPDAGVSKLERKELRIQLLGVQHDPLGIRSGGAECEHQPRRRRGGLGGGCHEAERCSPTCRSGSTYYPGIDQHESSAWGSTLRTGKKSSARPVLSPRSFFSHPLFNMQVPVWGQGFNLNPGLAWVFPVNDNLVLGLDGGVPVPGEVQADRRVGLLRPGAEITGSLGADYKLNEVASLSADFMLTALRRTSTTTREVLRRGILTGSICNTGSTS